MLQRVQDVVKSGVIRQLEKSYWYMLARSWYLLDLSLQIKILNLERKNRPIHLESKSWLTFFGCFPHHLRIVVSSVFVIFLSFFIKLFLFSKPFLDTSIDQIWRKDAFFRISNSFHLFKKKVHLNPFLDSMILRCYFWHVDWPKRIDWNFLKIFSNRVPLISFYLLRKADSWYQLQIQLF